MIRLRRCQRRFVRQVLISAFTLILVIFILSRRDPVKVKAKYTGNPFVTIYPRVQGNQQRKDMKTMLLWSKVFDLEDWATGPNTFSKCAEKRCRVTTERERLDEADAVLMFNRDSSSLSHLPPTRSPHQVWILHGSEPPHYVYLDWDRFNGVFNWTSWYRADADIFSPYGKVVPITSTPQSPDILPSVSPVASHTAQTLDYFAMHDRLVFWAASNCLNQNRRYRVVEELKRYLPVDSYGACGTLTCARFSQECQETLIRYKFVLAFENSNCRDYITEKYWGALERYQIPIVMGGANYSEMAVPGSFIDVHDFPTLRDLARFVLRVASDSFQLNDEWSALDWCQACQALHDETRPPQAYADLKGWVAADSCHLYSITDYIDSALDRLSFRLFGRL